MSTSVRTSSRQSHLKYSEARHQYRELERQSSFLHRLDVRLPWLKILAMAILLCIIVFDLTGMTISQITDMEPRILVAPMLHHEKVTDYDPTGKMLVALTFDDGPSSETTPALLDKLKERNVPATFFTLGYQASANPDLVKREEAEGHEVESHTMYHQNLIHLSASAIQADLTEAKATMTNILGHAPSLIRPPYGNFNNTVASLAGTPLILWSVDTLDWKIQNTDSIVATTMSEIHDGAIILMHDIYPTSVEAISTLIDTVRVAGYEFVTVSELARMRGVSLVAGASYYNFRP